MEGSVISEGRDVRPSRDVAEMPWTGHRHHDDRALHQRVHRIFERSFACGDVFLLHVSEAESEDYTRSTRRPRRFAVNEMVGMR